MKPNIIHSTVNIALHVILEKVQTELDKVRSLRTTTEEKITKSLHFSDYEQLSHQADHLNYLTGIVHGYTTVEVFLETALENH